MIQLALRRLRYPDNFDIYKKSLESEEEELFKEVRDELMTFLSAIINKDGFFEGFVIEIDNRINQFSQ